MCGSNPFLKVWRTVKIGGLKNQKNDKYLIRFLHEDDEDGDIRVTIVGKNEAGFSFTFATDAETTLEPNAATSNATNAANAANKAATAANNAASAADTAKKAADEATTNAKRETENAKNATSAANGAAGNANTATTNANNAANAATAAAKTAQDAAAAVYTDRNYNLLVNSDGAVTFMYNEK